MIATVTFNPSLDEWIHLARLRVGQLNRTRAVSRLPGGKGINVSRVIRELGGKTVAYALAGGDDGIILRQLMRAARIPFDFVGVRGRTPDENGNQRRTEGARPRGEQPALRRARRIRDRHGKRGKREKSGRRFSRNALRPSCASSDR